MTVLLNLSGGLDSALCLLQAQEAGRKVLVHHIVLETPAGRHRAEARAVERILAWMPQPVEYVESRFGWGTVDRVRDVHVWALFTGAILAGRPDVDTVIVPTHRDSFVARDGDWRERSADVLEGIVGLTARRQPTWERPLAGMTKRDIVAAMPAGLLAVCWWCREPRPDGSTCRRCLTCRQVTDALRAVR